MKMKNLRKLISSLLLATIILLPIQSYGEGQVTDTEYTNQILDIIESNYVNKINRKNLENKSLKEIFDSLDKHSQYYTKEEYAQLIENLDGNFVGIGVYIREEDGFIEVVEPIRDSPAHKAGLLPGDKILTVNSKSVIGLSADEATELIKGEEGTKVKLRIKSGNLVKIRDIKRERVIVNPVFYEIVEDIGYISLDQFSHISSTNVARALKHMDKNNISKIILDLRNNPGGYLNEAIDIANLLVPRGPVVHIKYKNMGVLSHNSYLGKAKYDLVVLVNENSASASEILAGAVQDRQAGLIVGVPTYGKGTVQEILQLPKGDGIKLTIAEYFSPNMNKINGIGVQPDIQIYNNGEEDLQLIRAIELLSPQADILTFM